MFDNALLHNVTFRAQKLHNYALLVILLKISQKLRFAQKKLHNGALSVILLKKCAKMTFGNFVSPKTAQ